MILDEVCELIVDCPHTTAPDIGKGYPLIRTPNIGRGKLILDGVHRVNEQTYNERNKRAVPQDNDLIFAREAPAGNVAIIKNGEKVCLGQRTVLIRPNQEIVNPDFLVYFLLAQKQQHGLLGTANGATVPHVNMSTIRNLAISLPSMTTQNRIADILSAYDDLIDNNQKQIKLMEEAAMRLYKEWFVNLRFPGHETIETIDGVPEGWIRCALTDVIDFNPTVFLEKNKMKRTIPMAALRTNLMVVDDELISTITSNSGSKFSNNDTLLARITPCLENGKTAFVNFLEEGENAIGSTEFIVMRSKKLNPYLVYCIARNENFRSQAINSMAGADGRQRVKLDIIKAIEFLLPNEEIINSCHNHMKPLFDKIRVLSKQTSLLHNARDKLLSKLMSGEIEV